MINKHAVYHRIKSNYAFALSEKKLVIRLRTASQNVKNVYLLYGVNWVEQDGIYKWNKAEVQMNIEFETDLFTYWRIEIEPNNYQLRYGFKIENSQEKLLYIERGFFAVDDLAIQNDINSYFAFPYINLIDVFKTPSWVKETVWYQIFPDRFCNGNKALDPENVHDWNESILGEYEFYGGDIQGIIERLDYLKQLGVNGIYLTPIFESISSHKYNTTDYFKIDPHFGTDKEFKLLVEEAHQRGMKVMVDAVFNHIGSMSSQFQDVIMRGKESPYYEWFYINEWPVTNEKRELIPNRYRNFSSTMPKLNTENPEVIEYLLNVTKYWTEKFDIDAWRLDVANEVDHEFWRLFRKTVKGINQDVYILGETWHDSHVWLLGDQFDATMNYPLTKPILEWVASRNINAIDFQRMYVEAIVRYSDNVNDGMFNLLDSHDTPRLITLADNNMKRAEIAYALLFLSNGSPCIFYGSEIALEGENDPGCRVPMPWDKEKPQLFYQLKKLIHIRKEIAFKGKLSFVYVSEEEIVLKKQRENEVVFVIINLADRECNYDLSIYTGKKELVNLMTNQLEETNHITVKSESYQILKE